MSLVRAVPLALVLLGAALGVPAVADAASVRTASRTQAVSPGAVVVDGRAPIRFTLAGVDWQGSGQVALRSRRVGGGWSAWRRAAPEPGDTPDGARGPWRLGNPWWTGASDRVQYRIYGDVRRVRGHFVWSSAPAVPLRRLAAAGTPAIIPRLAWAGSPTALRRGSPRYAARVRFAVVHHTAGASPSSKAQSAAVVRGVAAYHVHGNGWSDVGYNFLVDRFGQIFEGRYGGIDRNVIGAHAMGFNEGSVGIALLGSYGSRSPSKAALDAVARLIAWRLDVAHVDPAVSLSQLSGGNPRYSPGAPVLLRAVSGHRDTYPTSCPGERVYAQLPAVARTAAATGLPKLYEPRVEGKPGGLVRFRARLSGAVPWTASVVDADGTAVASGAGTGPALDWTWDARSVAPGRYTWSLAGPSLRPATGTLAGGTAALTISAAATPAVISPDGDGQSDSASIRYRLGRTSAVTLTVLDSLGNPLSTLSLGERVAGSHSFTLTADSYPDGAYQLLLTAESGSGHVTATVPFTVNRTLVRVGLSAALVSPNGDGRNDSLSVAFGLTLPAEVTVEARSRGAAQLVTGPLPLAAGEHTLPWGGRLASGARLADGAYSVVVRASNTTGVVSHALPVRVDTRPPVLRVLSRRPLRVRLSEAGTVRLRVDGRLVLRSYARAGAYRLYVNGRRVTAIAEDLAGNRTLKALHLR